MVNKAPRPVWAASLACIFLRLCIVLSLVFGILRFMQIHAMRAIVGAYFDYHVLCRSPIPRGKEGKGCRHPARVVHRACIVPKLAAAGVVHTYTHTICMVPDMFRFYIFFAMICVHAWKKFTVERGSYFVCSVCFALPSRAVTQSYEGICCRSLFISSYFFFPV